MKKLNNKLSIKRAFSFVEIAIVMFFILAISSITLSKIFIETRCPASVYKWKQALEEVKYAYNVALLTHGSAIEYISSRKDIDADVALLELFKIGMNVKSKLTPKELNDLEKYSYYFSNGKRVSRHSKYYVNNFVYDSNGEIFGLKWNGSKCDNNEKTCGYFIVDLNGVLAPNKFGVDVFGADIFKDTIHPFGDEKSFNEVSSDCSKRGSGVYCSKYYLICGKFN